MRFRAIGRFVPEHVIQGRMNAKDDRIARSLAKPIRGTALVQRRERRAAQVAAEQKEMQGALDRDHRQCRWPACEFKRMDLPIDPAHQTHRGMGGNPKLDRTTKHQVVALCRAHHGLWDAGEIDLRPLSDEEGFDGLVSFYQRAESGDMTHIASEQRIGESVVRSQS